MKRFFFILLFFAVHVSLFAQETPKPSPKPTPPDDDVVVETNLVRVDAIVVGKDNKQVTDLKPEDFEVFQNDVKPEITNFSYVIVTPTELATSPTEK
jgi:hypothetical protein